LRKTSMVVFWWGGKKLKYGEQIARNSSARFLVAYN